MAFLKRFISRWWKPAVTMGCTVAGLEYIPMPDWAVALVGSVCTVFAARK